MPKKLIFVFVVAVFLSSVRLVFASLIINEVMYDLSGADSTSSKSREWVEIYNPDSTDIAIDASKWRVHDGAGNRTINDENNFIISASSYVIFAGDKDTFLLDHPGFSGTVYDTGITSLNNTGATIKLLDQDGNIVDSFTYASSQGAAGDGNSLQKSGSGWISASPTPGALNQSTASTSTTSGGGIGLTSETTSNSSASSFSNENKNKSTDDSKIKTEIKSNNLAFVNSSLKLEATSFGYNKEILHFGKYFWNFGDGDSKEGDVNTVNRVNHTYFYPGDYVVTLEYYSNSYSETPDTITKFSVKVIPANIIISSVGDSSDFFVEILNNTNYDVDISRWIISSDFKTFVLPRNTIISSKSKIILSSKITNLSINDKNSLRLLNTDQNLIFDFGSSLKNTQVSPRYIPEVKENTVSSVSQKVTLENKEEDILNKLETEKLPEISPSSLGAVAINSTGEAQTENSKAPIIYFALLVGVSAGLVYFIRKQKVIKKPGDDFELLEE